MALFLVAWALLQLRIQMKRMKFFFLFRTTQKQRGQNWHLNSKVSRCAIDALRWRPKVCYYSPSKTDPINSHYTCHCHLCISNIVHSVAYSGFSENVTPAALWWSQPSEWWWKRKLPFAHQQPVHSFRCIIRLSGLSLSHPEALRRHPKYGG